jgi:hypothetical protein
LLVVTGDFLAILDSEKKVEKVLPFNVESV